MKVLSSKEVEQKFGMSAEQIDQLERDAASGVFHGEPQGEVMRGRPFMFGEEMRQVGFKEPLQKVDAIDRRAGQLGMRRSDYLRYLVDIDLEQASDAVSADDGAQSASCAVKVLRGSEAAAFRERWRRRAVLDSRICGERDCLAQVMG